MVLGAFGGLDLHGISHDVSWTQLAQTADAGSDSLVLTSAVDWTSGDEIVIASTTYSAHQTEIRTILSVNGPKVTLTKALDYKHLGGTFLVKQLTLQ